MSKSALEISEKNLVASVQNWSELVALVEANRDNATLVYVDSAGKLPLASATVAATGTIISDATALTEQINVITDADGAKGVILPVATEDSVVIVINSNASSDLLVYPVLLSQINALEASSAFTVSSGQTATFVGRSATLWNTAEMSNVVVGLTASGAELNVLDGVTAGTVTASKGLVVDASKDLSALNDVGVVNLDAGSSGVAGSVDVFPTTAASGKLAITCTDQGSDITSILNLAAQTQAATITLPDVNLATSYVPLSTAALTLAEIDTLTGLTVTTAEINKNDVTAQAETIDSGVAASVLIKNTKINNTGAGAITLGVPDATMYGLVKTIEMTVAGGDVTLALTNVQGGTEATTATFAAVNDCLVLIGGTSKWYVIGESGVVLS